MAEFDYLMAIETITQLAPSRAAVSEKMADLIDVCEGQRRHADWIAMKQLPFDQDVSRIAQWWRGLLEEEPPELKLEGLWFGLFNPVLPDGSATADIHVSGSAAFDADDDTFEWAADIDYVPVNAEAKSQVLAHIYEWAHRSDTALHNVAEYPLALGFAAFAISQALRSVSNVPAALANVGVAVGFDSGDGLLLGRLTPHGFVETDHAA